MISRRWLFGAAAGAVAAPVLAALPKSAPSSAARAFDEAVSIAVRAQGIEDLGGLPATSFRGINIRRPYADLADTLRDFGSPPTLAEWTAELERARIGLEET